LKNYKQIANYFAIKTRRVFLQGKLAFFSPLTTPKIVGATISRLIRQDNKKLGKTKAFSPFYKKMSKFAQKQLKDGVFFGTIKYTTSFLLCKKHT